MKRIVLTAIAAATFGSVAYAGQSGSTGTLMTRSEPATVTVFERDRGIHRSDTIQVNSGVRSLVDAGQILTPRERAIAVEGQIVVYTFGASRGNSAEVFSPR